MMKNLLLAIILLCPSVGIMAKDYYVSKEGSDKNTGTIEKPFQTINKAIQNIKPGDNCYLRAGYYTEEVDLTGLQGTAKKPIRITAYPGETVVFDGSDELEGKWLKHSDNIYKLKIKEAVWQLYQDKEAKLLARWPNASFNDGSLWDMKSTWRHQAKASEFGTMVDERPIAADYKHNDDEGASAFEVKEGVNMQSLAETGIDFTGATAVMNIGSWLSWAQPVIEHSAGSGTFKYSKDFSRPGKKTETNGPSILRRRSFFEAKKNQGHYYLIGLMALDAPNEWFYDDQEKCVYVYLKDGDKPSDFVFKGKRRSYNLKGKNVSFVTVSGIDFYASTFSFIDAKNVRVEHGQFMYPSCHKLALKDLREPEVTGFISNNKSMKTKGFVSANVIYNCSFEYADGPGFKIKGVEDRVENCYFHDIDWTCLGSGSSGTLDASGTERFVFRYNTVHTGGNSEGVRLGHANLAEYNHIYNLSLLQHDGSGINVGTNVIDQTIVRNNWVHDMKKSGIRFDSRGFNTIYVEWGENGTIDRNVVWRTGSIKAKGNYHTITNNISFDSNEGMYDIGVPRPLMMGSNNSQSVITCNVAGSIGGHFSKRKGYACPGDYVDNHEGDVAKVLRDPDNGDFRPLANTQCAGPYTIDADEYWIPGVRLSKATVPVPFDGANNVKSDVTLFWKEALKADGYEVYLGKDKAELTSASKQSSAYRGVYTKTNYAPKNITVSESYFWRVDVKVGEKTIKGDVWSFGGIEDKVDRSNVKAEVKEAKYREVTTLPQAILALKLGQEKEAELHKVYNTFWSGFDNYKWFPAMQKALKTKDLDAKKRKHLEQFNSDVMKESIDYLVENAQSICTSDELKRIEEVKKGLF